MVLIYSKLGNLFCKGNGNTENSTVEVHPLTENPTAAWEEISKTHKVLPVKVKIPTASVTPNKVRIVCMSDTHARDITFHIPEGDIFIHAGDFSCIGEKTSIIKFNNWLGTLPHKHKIVIAGNHDHTFDISFMEQDIFLDEGTTNVQQYLTNCIYLQDSSREIHGIKIYGTPWIPEHLGGAFSLTRGTKLLSKWKKIPKDIDILVTHTPPLGHGDLAHSKVRTGCVELLNTVIRRVKPKYHIFGHIHEGYGVTTNGEITFINASTCDISYKPVNPPIVFDMPLKS
ncbi:unnamed protein product [Acanthoscelides obtectus]|uniref:Calcineurin-like phosphoesterase domain-containing protein n=1 Tax=Acanthoscelides obtectus TaxID=200917 RepID=A0A9P0Q7C7_ACAOB|nr:unnamed protein product [Acanthoscelides obtectus]CAK1652825.1 Metallophosphoesterase domain-containing protein 1 [Acanthoscelides obtectus]